MAYEKQNWQTGEVITADKLNHMEDGIGEDSVFIINVRGDAPDSGTSYENVTSDKTASQIMDAYLSNKQIIVSFVENSDEASKIFMPLINYVVGSPNSFHFALTTINKGPTTGSIVIASRRIYVLFLNGQEEFKGELLYKILEA